jgi:16S rRNA (guanine527-N7)-methyltransferase
MVSAFRKTLLRIAGPLGRSLSDVELGRFETHYRLLEKWGRRMNLTGLAEEDEIARRHFLEPLAVADLLEGEGRMVDLGSGNGFPAVPLKVLRPGLELVLVESSEKKSAFLRAVIRELELTEARVETRRVHRIGDITDLLPCRYLTLRAVRAEELLKGRGGPILVPGGRGLFFVTSDQAEQFRRKPPNEGLRLTGTRPLPSDSRSVLAIFEATTA